MIVYLFTNDKNEIKNSVGSSDPEIYRNKKDAQFMKRNLKADYEGWKISRASVFVYKPITGPKHVERVGEYLDIQM